MSRIFWDSNLFIYLLEDYGEFSETVASISRRMTDRNDLLFTSTFTLGEVLVKPLETGDQNLAEKFEEVLSRRAALITFGPSVARRYARIRQDRTIRAPDAIQLACASSEGVDLFVTNDDRLAGKRVPRITFVTSMEKALLLLEG